jgi:hypothetical protein
LARHFPLHFDDRIAAIEHLTQNGTHSQGRPATGRRACGNGRSAAAKIALWLLRPAEEADARLDRDKNPGADDAATRRMFGLGFIVLVAYLIAMRPFRSAIARCMRAMSNLAARKR